MKLFDDIYSRLMYFVCDEACSACVTVGDGLAAVLISTARTILLLDLYVEFIPVINHLQLTRKYIKLCK